MAINFPNSPTAGDVHVDGANSFQWDGTVWKKLGDSYVIVSDATPVGPGAGQLWFNSDTGVLSVFYDDGSSTQWVNISPGVIPQDSWINTGSEVVAAQLALPYAIGTNSPTLGFALTVENDLILTPPIGTSNVTFNMGGAGLTTGSALMQIGNGRQDNGNAFIDLVGDTTYTDYGTRLLRSGGENGTTQLNHRGTGLFRLRLEDGGDLRVETTGSNNTLFVDGVNDRIGVGTATPLSTLHVDGQVRVQDSSENLFQIATAASALVEIGNSVDRTLGTLEDDKLENLSLIYDSINSDQLNFSMVRDSAGSNWTSAVHRIQRQVDVTNMGYIDFGSNSGSGLSTLSFGLGDAGSETLGFSMDAEGNLVGENNQFWVLPRGTTAESVNGIIYGAGMVRYDEDIERYMGWRGTALAGGWESLGHYEYAGFYLGTAGQSINSEITIPYDTTMANSDTSVFSMSAGVLTINKTADYKITIDVGTDVTVGTARSTSLAFVQLDPDGLSGFSALASSTGLMYNRDTTSGENSCTISYIGRLNAGAQMRVRAARNSGTDTVVLRANTNRFIIEEKGSLFA